MSHHRLIAITLLAFGMTASKATAQLLPERLVPPQEFAIPRLPMIEQPTVRRPMGADKVPAYLWTLPIGPFPGSPTALSSERLPADWHRAAIDVPMLASESDPARPVSPRQPVAPSAFAQAADPLKDPALERFPLPAEFRPRAVDDPTSAVAHDLITLAVPLASPNAAALLRLAIADPFEYLRAIRLANPPADSDALDATREAPTRPKLVASPD